MASQSVTVSFAAQHTKDERLSPPCHTLRRPANLPFDVLDAAARADGFAAGPNRAASCDSRCEEVPSAEAFKDNICLNKPPSPVGRFGEGSCGIRAPTPPHGEGRWGEVGGGVGEGKIVSVPY